MRISVIYGTLSVSGLFCCSHCLCSSVQHWSVFPYHMGHQQCQKANNPSHICPSRSKGRPQNIPAPGHTPGLHLVFQLQCWAHTQNANISFRSSHNYSRSIHIRGLCLQDQSAKANKEFLFKIQKSCTGPHSRDRHCGSQERRISTNTDNSS